MINIGKNRELFVDDYLLDVDKTTADRRLNQPVKRESVFDFDAPWESFLTTGYHNIVRKPDGTYLMYYKSWHHGKEPWSDTARGLRHVGVIESKDGLNWTRPSLDINPCFKNSNIVSTDLNYDNFYVFYDTNPNCPENERYKYLCGEWNNGLYGGTSPDGFNFHFHDRATTEGRLLSNAETSCHFDTLNIGFYKDGLYHAFFRGLHRGNDYYPEVHTDEDRTILRDVRHAVSKDFWHWDTIEFLQYDDGYDYEMYTNGIIPYYRAPQILTAIPTRYYARPEWTTSFDRMFNPEGRRAKGRNTALSDSIFMVSRDYVNFHRYNEAFISGGPEGATNWHYGDCYICPEFIETPTAINCFDPELSLYCHEVTADGKDHLFRYSLRIDGFVSMESNRDTKKVVTKPFVFDGDELVLNFATTALGSIYIKIEATDGSKAITSCEIFGDKVDRPIDFIDGAVADLKGKEVVMTMELSEAKVYSFKFN
ncbi:MAG: hypothetical protein IKB86_02015 [Clostridia bacterium]|nr:hypothetical protein [Clostridia bacterium]